LGQSRLPDRPLQPHHRNRLHCRLTWFRAALTRLVVGWAVTAIGTVGIAFWLVGGSLSAASKLEDVLLHGVTPIAALIFWIAFNAKTQLRWITALIWLVWPIAYFAYALTRGKLTGTYAYSFLDLNRESITSVATTTGMILAVYAVVALIVLAINKWRAPRSSQG